MLYIFADKNAVIGHPVVAETKEEAITKLGEAVNKRVEVLESKIKDIELNTEDIQGAFDHFKELLEEKDEAALKSEEENSMSAVYETMLEKDENDIKTLKRKIKEITIDVSKLDVYEIKKG